MGLHFAKVVTKLGDGVSAGGQTEGRQDGLMNLGTAPSVELWACMEQKLHETDHPDIVNLDAGNCSLAGPDRQSHSLKQRKVHVNVERLRFETGKAVGNGDQFL